MFQSRSVGIDIQPGLVRVAVATRQGAQTKILSLVQEELPGETGQGPDQAAAIVQDALRQSGVTAGAICVASLPSSSSANRLIHMPLTDPSKIKETLKYQIETQIPYSIENVVSDCVMIRKMSEGSQILAIAVTKDSVSEKLRLLKAAGADPQILTLDALALADFYTTPFDFSPERVTALLLTGREHSFIGFFIGERVVGYRNLDDLLSIDEDTVNGLVTELRRSIVGFQPPEGETVEVGALCVGGPGGEAIREVLQEEFRELPVREVEFNERALAEIPPNLSDAAESCGLAIALARAGLQEPANSVNFMREEFALPSLLSRMKSSLVFSAVLLFITLLAWFAGVQAQIHSRTNHKEALDAEMLEIFADSMPGIREPAAAERRIKQEREKFKDLRDYSSDYVSPLEVLSEVAKSVPDETDLTLNDMVSDNDLLRMTGAVDSFDDIDTFKKRIESSPLFSGVKIDSATKADKGKKVSFRIRADIGRESAPDAGPVGGGGS
jgi:type II secretory pathway component PulL